jgi:hypothetical protein
MAEAIEQYHAVLDGTENGETVSYGDGPHAIEATSADEAIAKAKDWMKGLKLGKMVKLTVLRVRDNFAVYGNELLAPF